MRRLTKLRPSPAIVVACIALFVALGGVGYAAVTINGKNIKNRSVAGKKLKKGAVGSTELRRNAVRSSKVKNGSLLALDFKAGQLPKGDKGDKGDPGTPGSAASVLGSGKTLRGTYALQGDVNGQQYRTGVALQQPLPAGLTAPNIHYIKIGDAVPAGCAGGTVAVPAAAPGHLCVFEGVQQGNSTNRGVVNPINDAAANVSIPPYGFGVYASCTTVPCLAEGTWAVTAP